MGTEIERRFLVKGEAWKAEARVRRIRQGYLGTENGVSVRVRLIDGKGLLTIKGERDGLVREEFEYPVPAADAEAMLELCGTLVIDKTRHELVHGGLLWQIDVFGGRLAGLVLAEVELEREDQPVALPDWAGREVSLDRRYRNSSLVRFGLPEA
ncbi:MAG: CYTH domain-containing protein [Alsobacter sp.]